MAHFVDFAHDIDWWSICQIWTSAILDAEHA